ncbi:hypothetical protein [sulfur-oxidizing endosymbiont of Gigantopelta aegis]|uniref:hypothetical protein n=1 Tax=sulfur-oxidizing endosymbiont of Gigantopelta aegis TaxID=2794934 RepID=UPI0018DCA1D9|nr:hypothetical protein [sulfur-oxidizing endosymbiont of Gigantopelta aegis]
MDEDNYRIAYKEKNPTRCYFEKMLLMRYGGCEKASKLLLAEREAFACGSEFAQQQCFKLIENLRSSARFSLQVTQIDGPLPHAKEIKVQVGGMFGLQQLLSSKDLTQTDVLNDDDAKFGEQSQEHAPIENIYGTVKEAVEQYQSLAGIPYNELVKAIVNFKLPERKRKKKRRTTKR